MVYNRVISAGSSKEAALYFDEVFPDDYLSAALYQATQGELTEGRYFSDLSAPVTNSDLSEIIQNLMPRSKNAVEEIKRYNRIFITEFFLAISISNLPENLKFGISASSEKVIETAIERINLPFSLKDLDGDWGRAASWMSDQRLQIVRSSGFGGAPTWINEDIWQLDPNQDLQKETASEFLITVQGLDLIDASKIDWDRICEFRKDKLARTALRDFRLFFADNLRGRDPNYVIDRLNQLQDENSKTARLWGFETITKAFGVVLEEKSLAASGIGLIATTLAGAPLPAIAAASLFVPAGRFAIKVAETSLEAAKSKTTNPLKYLTMVSCLAN